MLGLVLLCGCGYVGDPLPPALLIPVRIDDVRAVQRGESIVVAFTPPRLSTEQLVLSSLKALEIKIGPPPVGEFNLSQWADGAQSAAVAPGEGAVETTLPAKPWVGREVIIAARGVGPSGRPGEWSNLVVLAVMEPIPAPGGLSAANAARGVALSWNAGPAREGMQWRVFRQGLDEKSLAPVAVSPVPSWEDPTAEYGKQYEYAVQAFAPAGSGFAESEPSAVIRFTPKDVVAPAVPKGLQLVAGQKTIELNWDPNSEDDLFGYQIWRGDGDGGMKKLGDPVLAPSFSDRTVEPGKRYRYSVSALDRQGNESKPSESVEVIAQ